MDVDGVLTDGAIVWTSAGEEIKSFHVRDGFGIVLAKQAGIIPAILSGRDSKVTARRAQELGITIVSQGAGDKAAGMREILKETGVSQAQILMIGDDLPDLAAFGEAGLCACPADAVDAVRAQAHWVTALGGGRGALRECVDFILAARGQ